MSEAAFAIWFIGIGAAALVPVLMWGLYLLYKAKLLERDERRLMIERGMTPAPPMPSGWPAVKVRELELKAEERRLLIEKGFQPGAEATTSFMADLVGADLVGKISPWTGTSTQEHPPERYLHRGLVKLAFGLGLAGAYGVFKSSGIDASSETQNWFLFFGVISPAVTLWGVANVVYYLTTRNKRSESEVSGRDPVR